MTMPTVRPSPRAQLDLASKSACKVDEKEIVCDLEETFCNATTGVCTVVEDAEETYETCLVAFVVWVMPMVVAFSTIFFGFVCAFLQPGGAEGQQHISPKFFAQLMILMLFALWCAASLSSAAPEITEAFVAFTMVSVIAIGMLVVGSYGVSRLVYETENNSFVKDTIEKCARKKRCPPTPRARPSHARATTGTRATETWRAACSCGRRCRCTASSSSSRR